MTKKDIAREFLVLCARGDSREAFDKYAASDFEHHNPYFEAGAEPLILAMEENARENPEKEFEILRALEDADLVAVHSFVKQNSQDKGAVLVHIFRFEGDKIAELWDLFQAVPS